MTTEIKMGRTKGGKASQAVLAAYKAAQRNAAYLSEHYDELKAQFPDQWIAIQSERLVLHTPDFDEFIQLFRKGDFDRSSIVTEFLSTLPLRVVRFPLT